MRKLLVLISTMLIALNSSAQQEMGTIQFSSTDINYGTIKKDADGYREVIVTNTGKNPLKINKCSATCGCTVPNCPTDVILPGKSEKITVRYNTNNVGVFNKQITVFSSDQKNPVSILKIFGEVKE